MKSLATGLIVLISFPLPALAAEQASSTGSPAGISGGALPGAAAGTTVMSAGAAVVVVAKAVAAAVASSGGGANPTVAH